jgi:pimeloyl-ACP methyl ester carboxylesterase
VTVVFTHGSPETSLIWDPLRAELGRDSIALSLPGFGVARPTGFSGTKDAYANWLAEVLRKTEQPIDLVGHDFGALITLRAVTALDVDVRSYAVDVANIFHPDFVWPARMHQLQTPGVGEDMMRAERTAPPEDPVSTAARLRDHGVPPDMARAIGAAHDDVMSQSILDFYRSASPNVSAGWWDEIRRPTSARGLVLLLPDPPQDENMSLEVADYLGAATARLENLNHCWMAERPRAVALVLERFWSSLN